MRDRLPVATAGTFYCKLDETLESISFAAKIRKIRKIRKICRPACRDTGAGGRPGIDPAVYFKMLVIGFSRTSRASSQSRAAVPTAPSSAMI